MNGTLRRKTTILKWKWSVSSYYLFKEKVITKFTGILLMFSYLYNFVYIFFLLILFKLLQDILLSLGKKGNIQR